MSEAPCILWGCGQRGHQWFRVQTPSMDEPRRVLFCADHARAFFIGMTMARAAIEDAERASKEASNP